jgi:hypothetical protein
MLLVIQMEAATYVRTVFGLRKDTLRVSVLPIQALKKAILQMRNVYASDSATVVLEDSIEPASCQGVVFEILANLRRSEWIARLWTLQEAYLSRTIGVIISSVPQHMYQITSDVVQQMSRVFTLVFSFHSQLEPLRFYLIMPFQDLLDKPLSASAVQTLPIVLDNHGRPMWNLYIRMLRSLGNRKTSHPADGALCLAVLFNMDHSLRSI